METVSTTSHEPIKKAFWSIKQKITDPVVLSFCTHLYLTNRIYKSFIGATLCRLYSIPPQTLVNKWESYLVSNNKPSSTSLTIGELEKLQNEIKRQDDAAKVTKKKENEKVYSKTNINK
jgi:hypothetical protein